MTKGFGKTKAGGGAVCLHASGLAGRDVQPHVDSRCLPDERFAHDVEPAIAVGVDGLRLVEFDASSALRLGEVAATVAVEDSRFRLRVVHAAAPLRHLRTKDIRVSLAIDIRNLKTVTVLHVDAEEIV